MRGKEEALKGITGEHRITPAYAGKRCNELIRFCEAKDHPRLCGEKQYVWNFWLAYEGSPPPMRGKGLVCGDPCVNHRITPAYAGKRVSSILLHSTL